MRRCGEVPKELTNGEEHTQDRQKIPPEDCCERETLPLRHVPETQPEADEDTGPVVLPELLEAEKIGGGN
jgi:hypothetical protein